MSSSGERRTSIAYRDSSLTPLIGARSRWPQLFCFLCQGQAAEVKRTTDCQAVIINADKREEVRLRRTRERRAAETSEQRETRLARRGVADRAARTASSDRKRDRCAAESSD